MGERTETVSSYLIRRAMYYRTLRRVSDLPKRKQGLGVPEQRADRRVERMDAEYVFRCSQSA